jgi:hypothetical protein
MKIKMRYEWYNDEQTAMRYILEDDWNWRDYHAGVRASLFSMLRHPHMVDSVIDLREQTRKSLPSGIAAHMRSFGKKLTPALSGHAVVIGMSAAERQQLPLEANGTYVTPDGVVYFVADDAEARDILAHLRENA